jgi:hypothetical protein
MNLEFLTPFTVLVVRCLMLLQSLYYAARASQEKGSLQRMYYKGQSWGAMKVFKGEFKLTAEMLGSQLDVLNKIVFISIVMNIAGTIAHILSK